MNVPGRRDAVAYCMGETCWGFTAYLVFPATVLTVLLEKFGAGPTMIGAITSTDSLCFLPQILGVYLFSSPRRRQKRILWWHLIICLPVFVTQGLLTRAGGVLSPAAIRWGLLLAQAVFSFGIGIVISAWIEWVASLFPQHRRGRVTGFAIAGFSIVGMIASVLAGRAIQRWGNDAYLYLYLGALAAAMVSLGSFSLVRDPARVVGPDEPPPPRAVLWARVKCSLRDRNFRALLVARSFCLAGFCILPFITQYYTSPAGGALTAGDVVSCGAALTLGTALGTTSLGLHGDVYGHRSGMIIGAVAQTACLLLVLLASGRVSCLLAYLCAGVVTASYLISYSNLLIETCPHDLRIAHISTGGVVVGTVGVVVPLEAGWIVAGWGLRAVFVVSLVLGLIGLACFLFLVKEPRQVPATPAP